MALANAGLGRREIGQQKIIDGTAPLQPGGLSPPNLDSSYRPAPQRLRRCSLWGGDFRESQTTPWLCRGPAHGGRGPFRRRRAAETDEDYGGRNRPPEAPARHAH